MATRGGALQAPSATELRLAARRAITALRKAPRATAERALADGRENDENEENTPALEQLALYHLRQIGVDLEDEVRAFLSTGRVAPSGVVSFLLNEEREKKDGGREEAIEEILEGERVAAEQRSGALRALEQQPRQPRPRASGGADAVPPRLNETFVVGDDATAPSAIPRIAGFDGIRDYSEQVSARDRHPPLDAAAAAAAGSRRVVIVEEEPDGSNPWTVEEELCISAREDAMDDEQVARVVQELRKELVADRSFVATFRSGDMYSTARAIERRLRERGETGFDFDIGMDKEEEEVERDQRSPRDQRSKKYPVLPLLESTPLKARKGGASQHPAAGASAASRRSLAEDPPERVSIGVGTSARRDPQELEDGYGSRRLSIGVQCELEEELSSISSRHSRGCVPVSSEESSSFGQVPDRLLLQSQLQHVRVVQQPTAAACADASPAPFRVRDATISSSADDDVRLPPLAPPAPAPRASLSSPDSLMRRLLLQEEEKAAPPAPAPRLSRMYPSSSEEERQEDEEAENTLENLESIREID